MRLEPSNETEDADKLSVAEAAALLGVSDDTVRRWADSGRLTLRHGDTGRLTVTGTEVAALAVEAAANRVDPVEHGPASARNRFTGIVTALTRDTVMAQVEIAAGPYRVVSLISSEAVDELGLAVGRLAVATVKATAVGIERPVRP